MRSRRGTILDATALIDFRWLKEWDWLEKYYSPLYISQELLDSERLELETRQPRWYKLDIKQLPKSWSWPID